MNSPLCEICKQPMVALFTSFACKTNHDVINNNNNLIIKYPDVRTPPIGWKRVRWIDCRDWQKRPVQDKGNWFSRKMIEGIVASCASLATPEPKQFAGTARNLLEGVSCGSANIEYSLED